MKELKQPDLKLDDIVLGPDDEPPNRVRRRSPVKQATRGGHARIGLAEAVALGRILDPAAALALHILQWAGTNWARKHDGWVWFDRATRVALGLSDKRVHRRAVKRLALVGMIQVRHAPGAMLQYRLNSNWAKPEAEVVDLAVIRAKRRKA